MFMLLGGVWMSHSATNTRIRKIEEHVTHSVLKISIKEEEKGKFQASTNATADNSKARTIILDCRTLAATLSRDGHNFVKTKTTPSFEMNIHPLKSDIWVSRAIAEQGCWECDLVEYMQNALQSHNEPYFVDVGGNLGMYSLVAASMGVPTYTFEPFRANYERICRSVVRNGLLDRLTLFNIAAVSEPAPRLVFFGSMETNNFGGTKLNLRRKETSQEIDGEKVMLGITIDSVRDHFPKGKPVVVKMDIEGSECEALDGGMEFLREADLVLFLIEWNQRNRLKCAGTQAHVDILMGKGLVPFFKGKEPLDATEWRNWKKGTGDIIWRK
jgi:FkbM family methyltransferase